MARAEEISHETDQVARMLRRKFAETLGFYKPLVVNIKDTFVWGEVDGNRYTLCDQKVAIMVGDTPVPFSSLAHLAEILEAQADARNACKRPWWWWWLPR